MNTRNPMTALLAALGLLGAGSASAAPPPAPVPHYVYFTFYSNMISRLSPRPDLLETRLDLDLDQIPAPEALRRICARAGAGYTVERPLPEATRITLRGQGMLLFEALDQFVRQAGGGWMQELRDGKPVIRIGRDLSFMTIHVGPIVLPRDQPFLDQIEALKRARPASEPTDDEIRKLTVGQAAASGQGRNLLGRRGIPSLTIP